jgi:hypothetical protein
MREWVWIHIVLPYEMLRLQISEARREDKARKRDEIDWRYRN